MQSLERIQSGGRLGWQPVCRRRLACSWHRGSLTCQAAGETGGKPKKQPQQPERSKPSLVDKLKTGSGAPQISTFSAPAPKDAADAAPGPSIGAPSLASSSGSSGASLATVLQSNPVQVAWRRMLKELSSLPRAIGLMALVATLSGVGTFIPQNKPFDFYVASYPDGPNKVLGFLTYQVVGALQLDHIYTAPYFYLAIALLGASLSACTYTRQWPAVKVAQRWRFLSQPTSVMKQGRTEVLPNARVEDVGALLMQRGYQVFVKGGSLYAFKGLAGKIGPVGVHAALLLCLFGTAWSGFGGLKGSAMCPEGGDFVVSSSLYPASALASMPSSASNVVHVNKFTIDYRPDGSVAQFYSDLSLNDGATGAELMHKTISVNDPFRYGGVTMYQTDWSLAAVTLRVQGTEAPLAKAAQAIDRAEAAERATEAAAAASAAGSSSGVQAGAQEAAGSSVGGLPIAAPASRTAFNLPMASLEGRPNVAGRLWATFLPLGQPGPDGGAPRGISILARDPQSVVFYDSKGEFVGVRRPGSGKPIEVEGLALVVEDVVGATGLELKSDPGVPAVYAGFGALMVTTLVSYLSHSQVWALQQGRYVFVGGRSNRAKLSFENEIDAVLNEVPELPDSAFPPEGEAAQGQRLRTDGRIEGPRD